MNPAMWLSQNALWIAILIIIGYFSFKGVVYYLENQDKIMKFLNKFKKKKVENELKETNL